MIPGGDGKAPGEVADAPAGRGPSGLHAGLQGCPPAEAGPDRLAEPPGQERERDADLLDISPETVREWLRRYEERGINGLREGKNLVLDNYAIHRSRRVREFVEGEEGRRVALVFLPTYSPNLNIIEPFWKFVKAGAASNRFHGSVERLREAVNRFFRGCERGKIPAF
ncbi:MAG: transposase, partial [Halobacteria archaeon]